VVPHNSLYSYDVFGSIDAAEKVLGAEELELYKLQYRNLAFNQLYYHATGRQWLALYGRKHAPKHPMWPADSFNQTHTVTTKATHIVELPPDDFAKTKVGWYGLSGEEEEKLKPYQSPEETLTLNMTVLSVSPRAFEIQNFLSEEEVHHILELGAGMKLSRSTTKAGSMGTGRSDDATRTSLNSWIGRNRSPIVDVIFQRAADLLQIDEACFRYRREEEKHLVPGSTSSISERLQLVHYEGGQQYTPHHVSHWFCITLRILKKTNTLNDHILLPFVGFFCSRSEGRTSIPLCHDPFLSQRRRHGRWRNNVSQMAKCKHNRST
jgi:hypothetical protein